MEVIIIGNEEISSNSKEFYVGYESLPIYSLQNIQLLGVELYSRNWEILLMGGIILLIGMLGALILGMSHEKYTKKQDFFFTPSGRV